MSASERFRYWTNWIVKNLAALLTIAGLLGFSAYKQNETINQDDTIKVITEHLHKMGTKNQEIVPRGAKTVIIKEGCTKCLQEINKLKAINKTYHPR